MRESSEPQSPAESRLQPGMAAPRFVQMWRTHADARYWSLRFRTLGRVHFADHAYLICQALNLAILHDDANALTCALRFCYSRTVAE